MRIISYLRMRLNNSLSPRPMRFLRVRPKEVLLSLLRLIMLLRSRPSSSGRTHRGSLELSEEVRGIQNGCLTGVVASQILDLRDGEWRFPDTWGMG